MNADRWRQIEELYHAVRAPAEGERFSCLEQACGGDEALRREEESLLAQPASKAAGFWGLSSSWPPPRVRPPDVGEPGFRRRVPTGKPPDQRQHFVALGLANRALELVAELFCSDLPI